MRIILLRIYRQAIKTSPHPLIIKRKVTEDDGFGGKVERLVELPPPQEVAFYRKQAQRVILQDKGATPALWRMMKMLIRGDANVQRAIFLSMKVKPSGGPSRRLWRHLYRRIWSR